MLTYNVLHMQPLAFSRTLEIINPPALHFHNSNNEEGQLAVVGKNKISQIRIRHLKTNFLMKDNFSGLNHF